MDTLTKIAEFYTKLSHFGPFRCMWSPCSWKLGPLFWANSLNQRPTNCFAPSTRHVPIGQNCCNVDPPWSATPPTSSPFHSPSTHHSSFKFIICLSHIKHFSTHQIVSLPGPPFPGVCIRYHVAQYCGREVTFRIQNAKKCKHKKPVQRIQTTSHIFWGSWRGMSFS